MIKSDQLTYSVSDINKYIKIALTSDENLKFIHVKGEISNYKIYPSGHLYFSLKDKDSVINAVMFSNYVNRLPQNFKNGDEVTVLASIDVYPARGNYQLMVYEMSLVGKGNQLLELELLKKKLQAEGLFDENRKREINLFPKAIGIITAINGAAIKDLLFNLKRRYPIADIYVFPSAVQGENAPKELLKAFKKSQEYELDTLIIGRGGGASEDLNAFNDEELVRSVAQSKMPVISAVGHEIDITLIDFVADKRASTPTGAAELATIDRREIEQQLMYSYDELASILKEKVDDMAISLKEKETSINQILKNKLQVMKTKLDGIKQYLDAINPNNVLNKGYSITLNENGKVITSKENVRSGQIIKTRLIDGIIESKII